jgi:hypothetical protein
MLRNRIRQKVEDHELPGVAPARIGAGYGCGSRCDVCDEEVSRGEIAYDVQDDGGAVLMSLHLECYILWQLECLAREGEEPWGKESAGRETAESHDYCGHEHGFNRATRH